MTLGGKERAKPRAAFTLAPTQSRISASGQVATRIGQGLALDFTSKSKPSLTLAGVRADRALGLSSQGQVDTDKKLGISTVGWVAIGVGTAALAVGGFYLWLKEATDCDPGDECN